MKRQLLTGNAAAAWGARLMAARYIPAFPITPQTEIIETLAAWIDSKEYNARLVTFESEHSMITAAGAAASTGVRVFTATSSQGLLYAMEMLYTVAGWRAPFVMVNVSRGLSAPITLEPDHNDILAARDSGFLQLHAASCQEVLDLLLLACRLSEADQVRLPVIVNFDGFYLSFTREPVEIPAEDQARKFILPFEEKGLRFRASEPLSQATAVLGGSAYSYFRYQTHLAAMQALAVYDQLAAGFELVFGRSLPALENFHCDDAEYVFVMIGSFASKARDAVNRLRAEGWKIGLLRPRLLRPFPEEKIRQVLAGKKAVAIIDQNLAPGKGGVLYTEISAALGQLKNAPVIISFIGGLGGREISAEEFFQMAIIMRQSKEAPLPRLLYSHSEYRQLRQMQEIAHVLARPPQAPAEKPAGEPDGK